MSLAAPGRVPAVPILPALAATLVALLPAACVVVPDEVAAELQPADAEAADHFRPPERP